MNNNISVRNKLTNEHELLVHKIMAARAEYDNLSAVCESSNITGKSSNAFDVDYYEAQSSVLPNAATSNHRTSSNNVTNSQQRRPTPVSPTVNNQQQVQAKAPLPAQNRAVKPAAPRHPASLRVVSPQRKKQGNSNTLPASSVAVGRKQPHHLNGGKSIQNPYALKKAEEEKEAEENNAVLQQENEWENDDEIDKYAATIDLTGLTTPVEPYAAMPAPDDESKPIEEDIDRLYDIAYADNGVRIKLEEEQYPPVNSEDMDKKPAAVKDVKKPAARAKKPALSDAKKPEAINLVQTTTIRRKKRKAAVNNPFAQGSAKKVKDNAVVDTVAEGSAEVNEFEKRCESIENLTM